MKRIITIVLLFVLSVCQSVFASEPSFDCAKAYQQVERIICKSDQLSAEDLKLSKLYKNVLAKLTDDLKKEIKTEQLAWLKSRNKLCRLREKQAEACLLKQYQTRNKQLAALLAFDSSAQGKGELKLLRITPQGDDVLAGQQIVFQFDRPVVPIGRMERDGKDIPVTIEPALACEWRWLNTSALACQLRAEQSMQQATRYRVTMQPGIKTEQGRQLKQAISHSFTTTRPKVTYTRFVNWLSPGTPLIQVTFNQPVTKSSVQQSLFMQAAKNDVEPVAVITYPDDIPRAIPWWQAMDEPEQKLKVDDQLSQIAGEDARRVWVVEPTQELPLNSSINFKVKSGLVSGQGTEKGVENRVVVNFSTYPEFEFIGVNCTLKGERRETTLSLAQLQQSKEEAFLLSRCAPLNSVSLVFSAPVLNSMVKQFVQFAPTLAGKRKDYDPWQNTQDWTHLSSPHRSGRHYKVWLPELLQAYQKYQVRIDVDKLTDEFGRHLRDKVEFDFFTAHREPNLVVNHYNAVLEKGVESDLPLYVTNLDQVLINYDRLGDTQSAKGLSEKLKVAKAEDIAYAMPMGVKKLIGDDTGLIYARLHPDPVPPIWYHDPRVFAQVTPFQVHFKAGHFNSQAWVTTFAGGEPVKDAKVSILKGSYEDLTDLKDLKLAATTDKNGLAMLPGLADFDPDLKLIYEGHRRERPGLFVKVEHNGDIAVVPLNNQFSIWGEGVYPQLRIKGGHSHAWGTTAQGVYKLGDTVQFKIYLREQSNKHWVLPQKAGYELQVFDPQQKVVYQKKDILLNEFGAFDGEFKVSEQGAVGWYRFKLMPVKAKGEKYNRFTWSPMSVLVSDFTPSPFKVKTELNGELFKTNDQLDITALATMHSGGPFTDAEVRLTAKLTPKAFRPDNPKTKGFSFGSSSGQYVSREQRTLLDIRDKLDDKGQFEHQITLTESGVYYASIVVESAVKDDRGKFVAASAGADYAGRTRYVGLRNSQWLYEKGKTARLEALVVNQAGQLLAGSDISIIINHREYKAARVKGPGNAYLTQNIMQWVKETECQLKSNKSAVNCKFTPEHPGYYQFVATIKDDKQLEHKTTLYGWVTGQGDVVWDQTNDATLQIIPEQTDYKIGDTARYLIKNPFPGAKALVTIERYGVLESWIETLETSTPVIEVPIKPDYLPGFYLSVVAVSPRVEKPLGPGKVDLGKPSYRMGYVSANVSDPYKQIGIAVVTDKKVYKPREKVKADILIKEIKKLPYEIAVAVVDESVLALNHNGDRYYDPYAGFNRLDAVDVKNYSLISRLVGRQKFEKKGVNPGGDGIAHAQLRNQFKFVSYWNPSIKPDKKGKASIEFEVPDNLTGWRILAFAVTPDDRMGLGDGNIKVNRPTEIRPVMPNQVIEGDEFKAGFSVMNRTDKPRKLKLTAAVEGPLKAQAKTDFSFSLDIPAYKRQSIWLPLSTQGSGTLNFKVKGGDKLDSDAVVHSVPVNKRRSLETAATYGTTIADLVSESVKVPEGIYTDVGSIGAVLSPSVIGNLDGAFSYIKDYPHMCWEQRLTKAVVARSYIELKDYLRAETQWPKPETDIVKALEAAANFQAPNGGMVYWIPLNSHVSPYLSAYTAKAFNWLRSSGYQIPAKVEQRLHDYLLKLLRKDVFPSFYSKGMAASVRAVALSVLSEAGKIAADDIERYQPHVAQMDLFGRSQFLQAAMKTTGAPESAVADTVDSILGHASQSGGKFQFNEPWDDSYKYILATPLRSNCSILSSLLTAQTEAGLGTKLADIPFKLVRSISQSRGNREHWENTQENVFCLNALIDYARVYEQTDPAMQVTVEFAGKALGKTAFKKKSDTPINISRAIQDDDPGRKAKLTINKQGEGRLYYSARIAYDLKQDNAARINSGIEIRREYSVERNGKFELLDSPMAIKRGELVKVDLFVSLPTARHFVVVNDPIPGGLEPVNTQLATASQVDADKARFKAAEGSWFYQYSDWSYYGRYFWSFYHKELRHDSARFYADYLPAGHYRLSYSAQAIAEGKFTVMPVMAEEMYDPDVYGKGLPASLIVAQ